MSLFNRRTQRRESDAAGAAASRGSSVQGPAVTSIEDAPDRLPVLLEGTLRTVTLRPRGGVPALEAELADGTGSIILVWLGRRRIIGVGAGAVMRVQGRVGLHDGARTMFNPRYELIL